MSPAPSPPSSAPPDPAPGPGGRPSPAALNQMFAEMLRSACRLPRLRLYPEERMRLAGSAFFEAPLLVEAICRAVEDEPDLFDALPFDPAAVRAGQERARLYALLRAAFERLARRAHDLQLVEQAEATAQAMLVLRDGRCRLAAPCHGPAHGRLDEALRPAEEILAARAAEAGARGAAPDPSGRAGGRTGHKGRNGHKGSGGRARYRPDSLARRLREAPPRRPADSAHTEEAPLEAAALAPAAAAPRSPVHRSPQEGAPVAPTNPLDLIAPLTPSGPATPVTPQDIAAEAAIGAVRRDVADTTSALGLHQRGAGEPAPGAVLSATGLLAAQALSRLLGTEAGAAAAEAAGVPGDLFQRRLETDVALCGLGRAAGRLEATAAIGEIVLGARLTERVDRVLTAAEDDALPEEEREACATYLAGVDVIYERKDELQRGRRARAALRRERQAEERAAAAAESERLQARIAEGPHKDRGRLP